jgi:hypothetical protein
MRRHLTIFRCRMRSGLFDQALVVEQRPKLPGVPKAFRHYQVQMPDRPGVDTWATAVTMSDERSSKDAIVAAAVRHWCGEDLGQLEIQIASEQQLANEPHLKLTDLELFDPALFEVPGCPLIRPEPHIPLWWTNGVRYRAGSEPTTGWVPYGQVVVRWLDADPAQPLMHPMNMAGLGVGQTRDQAIEDACADLLAQDAAVAWWLYGSLNPLSRLDSPWGSAEVSIRLLRLPSAVGVDLVLAAASDSARRVATLAAARCIESATARALWHHALAVNLADPSGSIMAAPPPGLLLYQPDRSYLASSGPGYRRAVDPLAAVQMGLDPQLVELVQQRTNSGSGSVPAVTRTSPLLELLIEQGHEVWIVDLTTPDVANKGWHSVRVLATGLCRIPVPAFRVDPTARAATAAQAIGWLPQNPQLLPFPGL